MAFDPDKYLETKQESTSFDPDSYLKKKVETVGGTTDVSTTVPESDSEIPSFSGAEIEGDAPLSPFMPKIGEAGKVGDFKTPKEDLSQETITEDSNEQLGNVAAGETVDLSDMKTPSVDMGVNPFAPAAKPLYAREPGEGDVYFNEVDQKRKEEELKSAKEEKARQLKYGQNIPEFQKTRTREQISKLESEIYSAREKKRDIEDQYNRDILEYSKSQTQIKGKELNDIGANFEEQAQALKNKTESFLASGAANKSETGALIFTNQEDLDSYKESYEEMQSNAAQVDLAAKDYDIATSMSNLVDYSKIKKETVGELEGFYNAMQRGWSQGATVVDLFEKDVWKKPIDEVAKDIALRNAESQGLLTSEAFDKYQKAEDVSEALNILMQDPVEITGQLFAESMSQLLSAGRYIIPATTATGATTGAAIGGVPGAITGGGYGLNVGMSTAGFGMEYFGAITDQMQKSGLDLSNPEDVEKGLRDEELMSKAQDIGLKRGIPIALMDLLTGNLAGRMFKVGKIGLTKGQRAVRLTGEFGFQAAGEGAGEAAAQVASGEGIESKAILDEMLGGTFTSAPMLAVNIAADKARKAGDVSTFAFGDNANRYESMKANDFNAEIIKGKVDLALEKGDITEAKAEEVKAKIDNDIKISESIPDNIQKDSNREKSFILLSEKAELAKKDKALVGTRVEEINNELTAIANEPVLKKNTTVTDQDYGTINRNDGKGEVKLTKEEYLAEEAKLTGDTEYILSERAELERQLEDSKTSDSKTSDDKSFRKYLERELKSINKNPVKYLEDKLKFAKEESLDSEYDKAEIKKIELALKEAKGEKTITKTKEEATEAKPTTEAKPPVAEEPVERVEPSVETKPTEDDKKDEARIPSEEQVGKKPIEEKLVEKPSKEEAEGDRILQAQEVTPTEQLIERGKEISSKIEEAKVRKESGLEETSLLDIVLNNWRKITPESVTREAKIKSGGKIGKTNDVHPSLVDKDGITVEQLAENLLADRGEGLNFSMQDFRNTIAEILGEGSKKAARENLTKETDNIPQLKRELKEIENTLKERETKEQESIAKEEVATREKAEKAEEEVRFKEAVDKLTKDKTPSVKKRIETGAFLLSKNTTGTGSNYGSVNFMDGKGDRSINKSDFERYSIIKDREETTDLEEDMQEEAAPEDFQKLVEKEGKDVIVEPKEVTLDDVKNLDTKDETNLKKVYDFLDKLDDDLTKFGKETLGVNLPVATAKAVVKTLKAAVQTGMTIQNAIKKAAKDHNITEQEVNDILTPKPKPKSQSVESETTGLKEKDRVKQGFVEYVEAIKEKNKEKVAELSEVFKKKLSDARQKNKDFKDIRKEISDYTNELLTAINKAGIKDITPSKIKTLINAIEDTKTIGSLSTSQDKILKAINGIIDVDEKAAKKSGIEKLYKFAKAAAAVKRVGKTIQAKSTNVDGQSFFKQAERVLKAVISNDTDNMLKIMNDLADNEELISEASVKDTEGQTLNTEEKELLNLAYAFDNFADIASDDYSSKDIDALIEDFKTAKKISALELNKERQDRTDRNKRIKEKSDTFIKNRYTYLYDSEGNLKTENSTVDDKRAIQKELGLVDTVKEWFKEFKEKPITSGLMKNLIHNRSIFEQLDRKTDFFNKEIQDNLDAMYENKYKEYFKDIDHVNAVVNEITGKEGGLEALRKEMGSEKIKIEKDNGKTVYRTKAEMMRLYALSQNDIQKSKLINQGITEKVMDVMKSHIGKDGVALADRVVDYLSNEHYENTNTVFKRNNYVNMPRIKKYFPTLTESKASTGQDIKVGEGNFGKTFNAMTASSLKQRLDIESELKEVTESGADFFTELINHFEETAHYKAYADGVKDISAVIKNKSVDKLFSDLGLNSLIKNGIDFAVNEKAHTSKLKSFHDKALSKFTSFILSFKPIQTVKQATSFITAYENYSFRGEGKQTPVLDMLAFSMDMAKVIINLRSEIKEGKEISATFRQRLEDNDLSSLYGGTLARVKKTQGKVEKAGSSFTMAGDIIGVLGYKANYNRDIKNGMSKEDALKKFNDYNLTQQSRRGQDMSAIQREKNFIVRSATAFLSTSFLMINKTYSSGSKIMTGNAKSKDYRAFVLSLGAANTLFTIASNMFKLSLGDDDDKEEVYIELGKAALGLKMLTAIPLLGDVIDDLANSYGVPAAYKLIRKKPPKKKFGFFSGGGVNPYSKLVIEMKKSFKEDSDWEQYYNLVNSVQGTVTGANLNFLKVFIKLAKEDEDNTDAIMDASGITKSYQPSKKSSSSSSSSGGRGRSGSR